MADSITYHYQWNGNLPELEAWLTTCQYMPADLDLRHDIDGTLDIYIHGDYQVVNPYDILTHTPLPSPHLGIIRRPHHRYSVMPGYGHNIIATGHDNRQQHIATVINGSDATIIVAALNTTNMVETTGQQQAHGIAMAADHLGKTFPDVDSAVIDELQRLAREQTRIHA